MHKTAVSYSKMKLFLSRPYRKRNAESEKLRV